jgi:hypothetical protein
MGGQEEKKKESKGEEKRKNLNVFIKPGTIPNVDQKGSTAIYRSSSSTA